MKKLFRAIGLFFVALWVIGALLSLFTTILPHPKELPLPVAILLTIPVLVYLAGEMTSFFLQAAGFIKKESRDEKTPVESSSKKSGKRGAPKK